MDEDLLLAFQQKPASIPEWAGETAMTAITPPIAVLRAAAGINLQAFMARMARRWQQNGLIVAGVVEETGNDAEGAVCGGLSLRNLVTNQSYAISQDLGPGSTACNLDPAGISEACHAVETALHQGCDVVFLSKFAKQEAAGSGLVDAFRQAMLAEVPVVTCVSSMVTEEWRQFADGLAIELPPDAGALEIWWRAQRSDRKAPLDRAG